MEQCGNCLYFSTGYCRRYPPVVNPVEGSADPPQSFPNVSAEFSWCGEWKPKGEAEKKDVGKVIMRDVEVEIENLRDIAQEALQIIEKINQNVFAIRVK